MEKIRIDSDTKYRIEKIAPDGGYGWIIGIGLALSIVCKSFFFSINLGNMQDNSHTYQQGCFYGAIISFGIMYGEFLKSIEAETSAVAAVIGCAFGSMSCAGLFANVLLHSIPMRFVGLLGAVIFFLGSVLCTFVTSIGTLIFSFSILQGDIQMKFSKRKFLKFSFLLSIRLGFGAGLMTPAIYGTFNFYFVKKRVLAMSLVQILKGIFVMVHPALVGFLLTEYGFRGTVAIMAIINAHCILALLAMHPVEWHYKVVKIKIDANENVPCN